MLGDADDRVDRRSVLRLEQRRDRARRPGDIGGFRLTPEAVLLDGASRYLDPPDPYVAVDDDDSARPNNQLVDDLSTSTRVMDAPKGNPPVRLQRLERPAHPRRASWMPPDGVPRTAPTTRRFRR
jgi:hypothetical protein